MVPEAHSQLNKHLLNESRATESSHDSALPVAERI